MELQWFNPSKWGHFGATICRVALPTMSLIFGLCPGRSVIWVTYAILPISVRLSQTAT